MGTHGCVIKTVGGHSTAMRHPIWVFAYEYNPEPLGFNIITKKSKQQQQQQQQKPNIKADRKRKEPNLIKLENKSIDRKPEDLMGEMAWSHIQYSFLKACLIRDEKVKSISHTFLLTF